jgi:hypothetical protein
LVRLRKTAGLALLCLLLGCPGSVPRLEAGSLCWDGKDNDGDQQIDCDDSDCSSSAFCDPPQDSALPDQGLTDGPTAKDLQESDQQAADIAPDQRIPDAPLPIDSGNAVGPSFGAKCTWSGQVKPCPDGVSVCVLRSSGAAYCTTLCNGNDLDSCPAAGSGRKAACIYEFNQQHYCLFVCKYSGGLYTCPPDLNCEVFQSYQSHCEP